MTPQEFIAKFPQVKTVNDGCLEDFACPDCGNREEFSIAIQAVARVSDTGSDTEGDHEWDEKSYCRCCDCDSVGSVEDFTVEGLDDALGDREDDGDEAEPEVGGR